MTFDPILETVRTLISVVIGAIIGFFGSVGFHAWKENQERKTARKRIKEELEIIKEKMISILHEGKAHEGHTFSHEIFETLYSDILTKFDAKTSFTITKTHKRIRRLSTRSTIEQGKQRYNTVIKAIDETLNILDC